MARFHQGWVKLYRSASASDLMGNVFLWGIWHWLLLAATWEPTSIVWKGSRRDLPPGSIVLGLKELATAWECSPNTVKKWLKYLHDSGRISLEVCQRGTLVTITNWAQYQVNELHADCTQTARRLQTNCTQTANELHLNEELKKERIKENTYTHAIEKISSEPEIKASPLVAEKKPIEDQDLEGCFRAWLDTLAHFKAARKNILAAEQVEIVRAVQRYGSDSAVKFALIGARFEPKTEKFDPANFLKLSRILGPEQFNRFINLGIQAEHKKAGA